MLTSHPFIVSTTTTNRASKHHAFGLRDAKGREIGAQIVTYVEARTETEKSAYRSAWTGARFAFYPQATRDGAKFGALQDVRYFNTEAERCAAIAKYLSDARKRAEKIAL